MSALRDRVKLDYAFPDLNITVHQVGKLIDYEKDENSALIAEMIADILSEASKLCSIKAEYVLYDNIFVPDHDLYVELNGVRLNTGKIVKTQIKKSDSAAIFLCTAGPLISAKGRDLIAEKDFLRGYIFDLAGSEIVEAAADLMQADLKARMASEGRSITNRYSPGYCGWHVSDQHSLFRLIPDNYCGIKLHESALMDPVKSVSGIIGTGASVKFRPYTCSLCDMKDCIYRKHKEMEMK